MGVGFFQIKNQQSEFINRQSIGECRGCWGLIDD
jgi:hypothetical protein